MKFKPGNLYRVIHPTRFRPYQMKNAPSIRLTNNEILICIEALEFDEIVRVLFLDPRGRTISLSSFQDHTSKDFPGSSHFVKEITDEELQ